MARTSGSSALSTVQPFGLVIRASTDLTSASCSMVCTPSRPRWSALMLVTTETSLTAVPTPRSRMPPRAVSVTATCTDGSASTRAAPGLDQVRDQSRRGGLAVGPGHRDDRDRRTQRGDGLTGIVTGQPFGYPVQGGRGIPV